MKKKLMYCMFMMRGVCLVFVWCCEVECVDCLFECCFFGVFLILIGKNRAVYARAGARAFIYL